MLNLLTRLLVLGVLVLMLATTACSGVPTSLTQSAAPASVSPEPGSTPAPATTPDAQANRRNQPAQPGQGNANAPAGIEVLVKRMDMTAGIVRGANTEGIAIRTPNGNEKFGVDASTIIVVPGKPNAKVSDIPVGDRAIVDARKKKDLADFVLVLPASYTMDNLVLGVVQANSNGLLTVRALKETHTVTTNASTLVVKTSDDAPARATSADIKQGNTVIALGEKSGTTYTAQAIVILKNDLRGANAPAPNPNQTPAPKGTPIPPRQKPGVPVPTPNAGG